MPSIDLPLPLLVELFSPPPVYQDLPDTLGRHDPGEVDWKRQADEVLDGLKIDIEFDRHSRDLDVGAEAHINSRDRTHATEVLAQVGQGWSSAIERIREETRDALLSDLRRIVSPLMQPEMAPLRAQLGEVPSQWMSCVAACNALPEFLHVAAHEWPAEGFGWFMGEATAPGLRGAFGVVEALEALSRKTVSVDSVFPSAHAQVVVDWCKRSKDWKTTPEVAGMRLAHTLRNPHGAVCAMLEAASSPLQWDKVRWPTAIRHALDVPSDKPVEERHVAQFLETHGRALVRLFPGEVRGEQPVPLPPTKAGSLVRLDKPASLCALADIVANPQRRAAIVAELESEALSVSTTQAAARRTSPRL